MPMVFHVRITDVVTVIDAGDMQHLPARGHPAAQAMPISDPGTGALDLGRKVDVRNQVQTSPLAIGQKHAPCLRMQPRQTDDGAQNPGEEGLQIRGANLATVGLEYKG